MQQRYQQVKQATLVGALANIILAVVKVVFGWLGHSQALIADGIHSFSDLLTDALVILAAKYGSQAADAEHPYGHARIETFASLMLAMFLILVGFGLGWQNIHHLLTSHDVSHPDIYVIWFALFSVLVNEGIYRYTLRVGKKIKSDLLIANALHSRSDAASSLVVLIGVIGSIAGYVYLDAIAAMIVAAMIVKMGWKIGWDNVKELIDTGLSPEHIAQIHQVIMQVPGVQSVHELRTRRMAGRGLLDVHIIVDPRLSVSEGHHIAETVMWNLQQQVSVLEDVVVHIDSEDDENYSSTAKLPMRIALLPQLQKAWQGLPGATDVRDIRLHYLAGYIQLEVVLPLAVLQHAEVDAAQLQTQYATAAKSISKVSDVRLVFAT